VNNVIKSCEYHQHHDDREANAEPDLLRTLGERSPAQRLDRIEQKVTTIEQGDRE
jgi:hypothetical protein